MKRKILFLVLIVCALIFIGNRVYWFYRSGYNNLYMTISNQCNGCSETGEIVPFGIEVYIEYPIDSPSGINVLFESSPLGLM